MTPELWYHIEKNTPFPREEQETILNKLSKVIDSQILKEIEGKFDYSRKDKNS